LDKISLFKRNQRSTIKERWRYTAKNSIWRVILSDEGFFVCEDRDKDKKDVSFFCIEQQTGKVMWKDLQFEEKWWIGIEAVHQKYVFFHEYATPDMPDHKKVHAFDLLTAKDLWHNLDDKYLFAANESVYTCKDLFERRVFHERDIATGEVRNEVDADYISSVMKSVPEPNLPITFPSITHPLNIKEEKVKAAMEKAVSKAKNIAFVEFLEHNGLYIFGFYDNLSTIPDKPQLAQYLVILDSRNDAVIYNEIIASDVNAPIPDTFFCSGNNLFLVKDKKTLTALEMLL
jgi:hypothetical protein